MQSTILCLLYLYSVHFVSPSHSITANYIYRHIETEMGFHAFLFSSKKYMHTKCGYSRVCVCVRMLWVQDISHTFHNNEQTWPQWLNIKWIYIMCLLKFLPLPPSVLSFNSPQLKEWNTRAHTRNIQLCSSTYDDWTLKIWGVRGQICEMKSHRFKLSSMISFVVVVVVGAIEFAATDTRSYIYRNRSI